MLCLLHRSNKRVQFKLAVRFHYQFSLLRAHKVRKYSILASSILRKNCVPCLKYVNEFIKKSTSLLLLPVDEWKCVMMALLQIIVLSGANVLSFTFFSLHFPSNVLRTCAQHPVIWQIPARWPHVLFNSLAGQLSSAVYTADHLSVA